MTMKFFYFEIQDLNTEINQLVEKRMRSGEPMDDKLSLFRQQVGFVQLLAMLVIGLYPLCIVSRLFI